MWYCFVAGIRPFDLFNAIFLVGPVGRGGEKTPKKNVQSNTSTATTTAKMSAVLNIDNYTMLTSKVYSVNRRSAISGTYHSMAQTR